MGDEGEEMRGGWCEEREERKKKRERKLGSSTVEEVRVISQGDTRLTTVRLGPGNA